MLSYELAHLIKVGANGAMNSQQLLKPCNHLALWHQRDLTGPLDLGDLTLRSRHLRFQLVDPAVRPAACACGEIIGKVNEPFKPTFGRNRSASFNRGEN